MKLTLRSTADTDVWFVSENMRIADRIECGLSLPGLSPLVALLESVRVTHNTQTLVDPEGEPIAIFGCSFEEDSSRGYPWMLSTPYVKYYPRDILVLARRVTTGWGREAQERGCPLLCNWIYREHDRAKAFVAALGFSILPTPNGEFDFFYAPIQPCASPQQ
jgi:hypothetical protein